MISLPGIGSLIVRALLTGGGFLSVVQLTLKCSRQQAPDHLHYMAGLLTCGAMRWGNWQVPCYRRGIHLVDRAP